MSTSSARKSNMFRFPENGSPERELRAIPRTAGCALIGARNQQAPAKLGNLLRGLLALLLVLSLALPVLANQAENYYKQGQKAESKNDYDGAYQAYVEASKLEPKNAKYMAAVARLRFYAAMQHVHAGTEFRESNRLNDAAVEFERAVAIDPTSLVAKAELQKTADMIKNQAKKDQAVSARPQSPLAALAASAEGPIEFHPTSIRPSTCA